MKHRTHATAAARGFTLVELMVVVTMVAILSAIALSSYKTSVMHSRRVDAKTAILDLAAREERNYSTTNTYSQTASVLGYTGAFPLAIGSGYYQVNVTAPQPNPGAPPTFQVQAIPIGTQAADTACAFYNIDQTGKIWVQTSGLVDNTAACM